MLTVTVAFEASGKSSTFKPLSRRYSVIPSTDVTFTGGLASATETTKSEARTRARVMGSSRRRVGPRSWTAAWKRATSGFVSERADDQAGAGDDARQVPARLGGSGLLGDGQAVADARGQAHVAGEVELQVQRRLEEAEVPDVAVLVGALLAPAALADGGVGVGVHEVVRQEDVLGVGPGVAAHVASGVVLDLGLVGGHEVGRQAQT